MNREILVFGSCGVLGSGVVEKIRLGGFNKVWLFGTRFEGIPKHNEEWVVVSDLSNEENVKDTFKNVVPAKDKFLFLFSTIGGYLGGKEIEDTSLDDIEKMFSMNLKTNFNILKEFKKLAADSAGGSAIFTSAMTAFTGESGKSAYGASKAALSYLVETASEEGRKINMSVNAIAPFILDTPDNRSWVPNDEHETLIKPTEVGDLILSLFDNFHFISGNIIKLRYRFPIGNIQS
ncbi:MAG: SDR family oxidoreductase [Ignavibacteriales bacterium]|nr:SDR family oxidoreductase [Ignavibacteriales bacterium]MBK8660772.1 SDR family oxidoreductase [Ignavibacteriales bacterium]MCC6636292.1 SDR family oxidoreductase [Ignavibacteriaceae bacterium]